MKNIFALSLLFTSFTAYAQVAADSTDSKPSEVEKPEFYKGQFSKIVNDAELINNGNFDNGYELGTEFKNYIIGALTSNVVVAYNLEEKYDSELKRKIFTQSSEYKQFALKLAKDKEALKEKRFYYTVKNWEGTPLTYSLASKTFTVKMPQDCHSLNKVGAIQLSDICIYPLVGVIVVNKDLIYDRLSCSVVQAVSYKVANQPQALKIEENEDNIVFTYVFSFVSARGYSNQVAGNYIKREGWHLFAKPEQVIIHNRDTGDVYQVFDVVQPVQAQHAKTVVKKK